MLEALSKAVVFWGFVRFLQLIKGKPLHLVCL